MSLSSLLCAGKAASLTSYFSVAYLGILLPIAVIIYSILPQRFRRYFLLVLSYVFFWLISGNLLIFLLLSTLSIHYVGIWLDALIRQRDERVKEVSKEERKALKGQYLKKQRLVVFLAVVINLGILLVLKYTAFFTTNINSLLEVMNIPVVLEIPEFIMPIGISFYTMQAISYVMDVYHGVIKAEYNLGKLALYMNFFPQIVEGPICRYSETADKLWNVEKIKFDNLKFGLQRILYGLMKKLVIVDRLNPLIKEIFTNYDKYEGGVILIGAVCYTCQLYMDFSGSMDAVMGTAQIFGITMPENFKQPFFSRSISEFWKRWHITLGAWFKDYIFYPVTMSKPMKNITSAARKKIGNHFGPLIAGAIALFCVWISNGLWHGSAWSYIFFGMYHFVLILGGNIIEPYVKKLNKLLHINTEFFAYRAFQMIRTGFLVVIGELFFRANGLRAGLTMFKRMITDFSFKTVSEELVLKLGIDMYDVIIVMITVAIVFVISVLREKGISVRKGIDKRNIVIRWAILYALIIFIVICGAYGRGYIPIDPMYANF